MEGSTEEVADPSAPLTPDELEDVRALQKKDRWFLLRVAVRVGVAILLGVWVALALSETNIGEIIAGGFEGVTQSP